MIPYILVVFYFDTLLTLMRILCIWQDENRENIFLSLVSLKELNDFATGFTL